MEKEDERGYEDAEGLFLWRWFGAASSSLVPPVEHRIEEGERGSEEDGTKEFENMVQEALAAKTAAAEALQIALKVAEDDGGAARARHWEAIIRAETAEKEVRRLAEEIDTEKMSHARTNETVTTLHEKIRQKDEAAKALQAKHEAALEDLGALRISHEAAISRREDDFQRSSKRHQEEMRKALGKAAEERRVKEDLQTKLQNLDGESATKERAKLQVLCEDLESQLETERRRREGVEVSVIEMEEALIMAKNQLRDSRATTRVIVESPTDDDMRGEGERTREVKEVIHRAELLTDNATSRLRRLQACYAEALERLDVERLTWAEERRQLLLKLNSEMDRVPETDASASSPIRISLLERLNGAANVFHGQGQAEFNGTRHTPSETFTGQETEEKGSNGKPKARRVLIETFTTPPTSGVSWKSQ